MFVDVSKIYTLVNLLDAKKEVFRAHLFYLHALNLINKGKKAPELSFFVMLKS